MGYDGSGNWTRQHNWVTDKNAGVKIVASRMDAEIDDMASGLSKCIVKDGQQNPTANLPMATYKHTGVGAASARTEYLDGASYQDGQAYIWGGVASGTSAITIGLNPPISAYTTGMKVGFIAAGDNASACTFNADAVSAVPLVKGKNEALAQTDIVSGGAYWAVYKGADGFQLLNVMEENPVYVTLQTTGLATLNNVLCSGSAVFTSSFNVSGVATFSSSINVSGTAVLSNDVVMTSAKNITTLTDEDLNLTPNGTGNLVLDGQKWPQADGSARQILRTDGAGQLSYHTPITLAATQATTSGTAIDFTSIPAGTKRIKLFLSGVSLSGTDTLLVQLGDSGGFETTGYSGITSNRSGEAFYGGSGFELNGTGAAAIGFSGVLVLDLADAGHVWAGTSIMGSTTAATGWHGTGLKTLSGELTQVRLTRSGSDTFDGGSASLSYE